MINKFIQDFAAVSKKISDAISEGSLGWDQARQIHADLSRLSDLSEQEEVESSPILLAFDSNSLDELWWDLLVDYEMTAIAE